MPYANPEMARTYQREYRRQARAGESTTPRTSPLPAEFRIQTAADVLDLLDEQVQAVRGVDEKIATPLEKARCVGYLAGVALRAIEAGDLAARLESLEAALKQRPKSQEK